MVVWPVVYHEWLNSKMTCYCKVHVAMYFCVYMNFILFYTQESYRRTASSVLKTDENLSASLLKITDLEKALSAAGEKFIFMQKLRDFVSVICDFLQVWISYCMPYTFYVN